LEARPDILLVDDVAMFRELGALFLARSGRVTTAAGGIEALAVAHRNPPDLMLVDLLRPDLDGAEVCQMVKSDPDLCDIPVIMMVGHDEPRDWGRAVRAGANDVLPKPLSRAGLITAVSRLLGERDARGRPRVALNAPAELSLEGEVHDGLLHNISRGGLFVETPYSAPEQTEFCLRFELPDSHRELRPTAEVVWQRTEAQGEDMPAGLGMRFIEIDGGSVQLLDDFVLEWFEEPALPTTGSIG
jgi:uncharacterized protein (TIGR02266 family)